MSGGTRWGLLGAALGVTTGAVAAFAGPERPPHGTFALAFAQRFETVECAADAPPGFYCLDVTGEAAASPLGAVRLARRVTFDIKRFDHDHPACIPDETAGTLTLPRGTVTFRAPGSVCLADGTASYGLIVTGGTGAYAGVGGGGQITVTPPLTDRTGREFWRLELF